ncbi:FUSC family protein [Paenibacillus sediminis]|uniref:Uncharacterized membrane protein YgaE (UPF0421/DUF939 family) n=1 Tax=Paenibacillus sediminis TaxID=664909 RepID=A0ABS4H3B4_9BACL|nr:FUSC family protein [Paenibacillus sediminis]MBP1937014.1 uncharacterized membrane protein YgaE (UPF0421/DUF939 family) [Paenibacillus sediminis]
MNETKQKRKLYVMNTGILILKMAAVSGLSWELAELAGSKHPYLAPLTVILCLQTTVQQSIQFSYQRTIGTIIGVVIAAMLASILPINGWALAFLFLIGTCIPALFKMSEVIIHQVALSLLLVFALEQQSGHYPIDRIRDTVIGAALAVLVHIFIFPPDFTKEARDSLVQLTDNLSQKFSKAADWIKSGCELGEGRKLIHGVHTLQEELFQSGKDMEKGFKSIKFNPYSKKSAVLLTAYRDYLHHLKHASAYIEKAIKMIEIWSRTGNMSAEDQAMWASQLQSISSYWKDRKNKISNLEKKVKELTDGTARSILYDDPVLLQPSLPAGMEAHQYAVSLYTDTEELLKELHH